MLNPLFFLIPRRRLLEKWFIDDFDGLLSQKFSYTNTFALHIRIKFVKQKKKQ